MSEPVSSLNAALDGRYRILRELGSGGMAIVYMAEDLRHERNVAVKVLRPELAAAIGAARFLTEIKTTARLQHPHILPLFDSGQAGPFLFYVMPYVEGESLRSRLDRERQLPVEDAVRIATQIAEALDQAHRQEVIHRDIKPGNILLRDGDALVADFGIALALAGSAGRLTETGLSIGTPQYMSPEQATGDLHVGAPTDIWSLGCVLYEMLAGEPPYGGATHQAILGRIIAGSVEPVTVRRRTVPAHVAAAIARAIETVPSDRFSSTREFARALADPNFRHGDRPIPRRRAPLVAAAVAAFLLGAASWQLVGSSRGVPPDAQPVRFVIPGPISVGMAHSISVSADGSLIALGANEGLTVHRLTDFGARKTLESTAVQQPFFSPDGQTIGYFRGVAQSLNRIAADGGTATQVTAGTGARPLGGSWGTDGTIVFATTTGLYRVHADGGEVELLKTPDRQRGELAYAWPAVLPGNRFVLFTVLPEAADSDADGSIACLDLANDRVTTVLTGGSSARYAPSGHLVYTAREGIMHAVAFNPATCRTSGEKVTVPIDGLSSAGASIADFDISPGGTLVFLPTGQRPGTLVWRDRAGTEEPVPVPARDYNYPRVSPDGERIAVDVGSAGGVRDIYLLDVQRGTSLRLTREPGEEVFAHWNAAADSVYFSSNQTGGTFNIFRRAVDGTGESELVFASNAAQMLNQIAPDGSRLIVSETRSGIGVFDVMSVVLTDPVRLDTLLSTSATEYNAVVSADGRLLAYQSDATGQSEIYVGPMTGAARSRLKVSVDGGEKPLWSLSGDTIFYRSASDSMMAASLERTPNLRVRTVTALFRIGDSRPLGLISGREWDLSPRDGRFLLLRRPASPPGGIHVAIGWTKELLRALPR